MLLSQRGSSSEWDLGQSSNLIDTRDYAMSEHYVMFIPTLGDAQEQSDGKAFFLFKSRISISGLGFLNTIH
jgi:hypothetical protein